MITQAKLSGEIHEKEDGEASSSVEQLMLGFLQALKREAGNAAPAASEKSEEVSHES